MHSVMQKSIPPWHAQNIRPEVAVEKNRFSKVFTKERIQTNRVTLNMVAMPPPCKP